MPRVPVPRDPTDDYRRRRPAAGQRRGGAGRVLRAAGHGRGHAGRQLQPRHEAAVRGGRGHDHRARRPDAARPRVRLPSAREAAAFGSWLEDHFDEIREAAEATTKSGRLQDIEHFFLESNFATDKKSSQVNMLRTRGKRVVAEATIPNALFESVMHSSTEVMFRAGLVSNLGGFMSGVNNNGAHSANGITAMFIATGQDVANVAESSAAFVHAEVRENGDYNYSVTIPSLIVATYGGGTSLATQREYLELLGRNRP